MNKGVFILRKTGLDNIKENCQILSLWEAVGGTQPPSKKISTPACLPKARITNHL